MGSLLIQYPGDLKQQSHRIYRHILFRTGFAVKSVEGPFFPADQLESKLFKSTTVCQLVVRNRSVVSSRGNVDSFHEGSQFLGSHWFAEKKALHFMAAQFLQAVELSAVLDPFGNHL